MKARLFFAAVTVFPFDLMEFLAEKTLGVPVGALLQLS